jgi:hypothetical protein
MCLTCRCSVNISQMAAFKIFAIDADDRLYSPFCLHRLPNTYYAPDTLIDALPNPHFTRVPVFFAFENFEHAVIIARQGANKWDMVNAPLTVLPVTLYNVVSKGTLVVRNFSHPSSTVGHTHVETVAHYPAFESREIIVHDSQKNRTKFYNEVGYQYWKDNKAFMGLVDQYMFVNMLGNIDPTTF